MSIATLKEDELPPLKPVKSDLVLGYLAIAVAVTVWAGFALSIRAIGASPLATADVALIRFGIPTLLLLPMLPSRWRALCSIHWSDALMVLAGAGLPFFWIAAAGGAQTSAAHVGALIAGTVPVSVAILGYLLNRTRISPRQRSGLIVIVLGVIVLVAAHSQSSHGNIWQGAALLLTGSLLWAAYTIGLRRTGLDAVGCTLLLTLPSFLALLGLLSAGAVTTHLGQFGWAEALPFLLVQGLGVGVVASLTYAAAISRLGPTRSAVIGSLAPALATIGAVPLLGEALTPVIGLGVAAITVGVILANRS